MQFWRTLNGRLSLVFLTLLLTLGSIVFMLGQRNAHLYFQKFTQQINSPIAMYVAEHLSGAKTNSIDADQLLEIAHHVQMLNPSVEIYLLDAQGYVLDQSIDPKRLQLNQIDLGPVRKFLENDQRFPLLGDDPRNSEQPMIFSVHPLTNEGGIDGYIYAVLAGEDYRTLYNTVSREFFSTTLLPTLGTAVGLASAAGLLIFFVLTRRLRKLKDEVLDYERQYLENELTDSSMNLPRTLSVDASMPGSGDDLDALAQIWRNMNLSLQNQNANLAAADKQQRELVANVSHDLRTPLTVQQGYLETLVTQPNLSSEKRQHFTKIALRQSQRLQQLVGDLFELAQLDRPGIAIVPETFSITDLAADCLQAFQLRRVNSGPALLLLHWPQELDADALVAHLASGDTTEIGAADILVDADIALTERVLYNLCQNALRHCQLSDTVAIFVRTHGAQCDIAVVDTGCGIAATHLPHVMERHYGSQGNGRGSTEHAGLGLAIVKRIAKLHGSELIVSSEENSGTAVAFTITARTRYATGPKRVTTNS